MILASWNVNSIKVRLPQVLDWLGENSPDVIGLQELKLTNENFPLSEIEQAGYRALVNGQPTYNGVALLSRQTATDIVLDLPGFADPQRRFVAASYGDVRVVNLYVPNGQAVGSDKFAYKLEWLGALERYLRDELERHPRLAVIGDFNIAPADRDVHDPAAWEGSVHVSPPEREALARLAGLGLKDTFRLFHEDAGLFSWWDYRGGAFRRNHGLRIDLILASPKLAAHCREASIDVTPRRLERPSDHAPVIARFET